MSKEIKKSGGEKTSAKVSKPAAKKSAPVAAVKRPEAVQKKKAGQPADKPAAKSNAKPATKAPVAKAGKQTTQILVRASVGYGNQVFARGEGPGMSWDHGVALEYKESDQWVWSAEGVKKSFPFKVLLNDQLWSHGENEEVKPGETKVVEPAF